jgi:hypothetical protein
MTVGFEQATNAGYEDILFRHLANSRPPDGWAWAQLTPPVHAIRIDNAEEGRFVAELLELIRQRCSATLAKDTSPQGFWIKDFSSLPVLDKYLSGGVLKIFPGEAAPDQPWIQIFP